MNATAQFDVLQPVENEQRALDAADFAQCDGEAVLSWIAAKLAQHQRSRDGALPDRRRQTQNLVPVPPDVLFVVCVADH